MAVCAYDIDAADDGQQKVREVIGIGVGVDAAAALRCSHALGHRCRDRGEAVVGQALHLGVGGADLQGHLGGETIEGFALLLGGMLTEWASWRWVMYVNVAFAAPALIGALLLAKPAITKKPKLNIPGIVVASEGRPVALDNSVQNRLGF
ncbi:hypothetical protein IQ62_40825 [Streptomyces scabiei]|nr:hypothetical protein IQ62_40825 [Streptomyces scabiei]